MNTWIPDIYILTGSNVNFYLKSSEMYRDNYNSIKELGIEPRSIEDFAVIEDIMTNLGKLKDLFQSQVPDELYNRI